MKKINMEGFIQIVALFFLAGFLIFALQGNRLRGFVHPRINNLLWVSAGVLLLMALFRFQVLFKVKRRISTAPNLILLLPLIAAVILTSTSVRYNGFQTGNNDTTALETKVDGIYVNDVKDNEFLKWYLDVNENPEKYDGTTVKVRVTVFKSNNFRSDEFVAARMAMSCCAADIAPIGFLCRSSGAEQLVNGSWVYVTAVIWVEYQPYLEKKEPILYPLNITKADKPEEEYVYP